MLAAGDLLWVPFTYSLQARYLAFEHIELGGVGTAIVVVVAFTGYLIFRSANGEKNDFRNGRNPKSKLSRSRATNPNPLVTDLTYMETKRGTKLLTSGWWGKSRHPNYLFVFQSFRPRVVYERHFQRRLVNGFVVVSCHRIPYTSYLFLPHLLLYTACPQTTPRR
jgi:hypothetical protein